MNFLSKELNARTDETLVLMRQIDEAAAEVKKLQVHTTYLEGAKQELEGKLLERQRELD